MLTTGLAIDDFVCVTNHWTEVDLNGLTKASEIRYQPWETKLSIHIRQVDTDFDDMAFAHILKDYSAFSFIPRLSYAI